MSNKTSDKNVANIEDDVKYVKELLEIARVFFKAVKAETDYKNVDEIAFCNALENILAEREQMIAEKKKYTIRLTDEQYRKVIENAQMDTSNDTVVAHRFAVMQQQINEKDKQIQELEEENHIQRKQLNDAFERGFIHKDKVKEALEYIEDYFDRLNGPDEDIEYIRQVKKELLEGERK